MRRGLVAVQLACFVVAGAAMSLPDVGKHLRDWSGATIYPWWAPAYAVLGVLACAVLLVRRDHAGARVAPTVLGVLAAQLAGLGLVAVKHWEPSFGMGGGFAGGPDTLVPLAWVLALAAVVAALSAVLQLVVLRAFPSPAGTATRWLLPALGLVVLLALPVGIGEGDPQLQDATSLGAFVLIYSGPIGLTVAASAWLPPDLRVAAVATCAVGAAVSAGGLITDLSYLKGAPALSSTAVVLAVLALLLQAGRRHERDAAAVGGRS